MLLLTVFCNHWNNSSFRNPERQDSNIETHKNPTLGWFFSEIVVKFLDVVVDYYIIIIITTYYPYECRRCIRDFYIINNLALKLFPVFVVWNPKYEKSQVSTFFCGIHTVLLNLKKVPLSGRDKSQFSAG